MKQKGFTLIELILVIFIIGTLSGLGLAGLNQIRDIQAYFIKEEIKQYINLAQKVSIISKRPIFLNCKKNKLSISWAQNHSIPIQSLDAIHIPQHIAYECPRRITFYPLLFDDIELEKERADIQKVTIASHILSINPLTGYIDEEYKL